MLEHPPSTWTVWPRPRPRSLKQGNQHQHCRQHQQKHQPQQSRVSLMSLTSLAQMCLLNAMCLPMWRGLQGWLLLHAPNDPHTCVFLEAASPHELPTLPTLLCSSWMHRKLQRSRQRCPNNRNLQRRLWQHLSSLCLELPAGRHQHPAATLLQ